MTNELHLDWSDVTGLAAVVTAVDPDATGNVRLVGGCVRDRLLGRAVADFDLATTLRPDAIIAQLATAGLKAIPTGLGHGTVTALCDGQSFEITTLRHDVTTDGRHATVAFTDDWAEDAKRRDFTINALYSDPRTGEVYDPVGGLCDLNPPYIRFIGDAGTRIREDYLRVLRYFRFFARFGDPVPDGDAMDACALHAKALMALSRERVAQEIWRIFGADNPAHALRAMEDIALFDSFMNEYISGSDSTIAAMVDDETRLTVAPSPIRRLSAVLPPEERTLKSFATRMKMSRQIAQQLVAIAHARFAVAGNSAAVKPAMYAHGKEATLAALLIEQCGELSGEQWRSYCEWPIPDFPIKGRDLVARGLPPGPLIAQTLKAIEQDWVEQAFPTGAKFDQIVETALAHAR